jgi:hypothetical protein
MWNYKMKDTPFVSIDEEEECSSAAHLTLHPFCVCYFNFYR